MNVNDNPKKINNYLLILGWKLHGYEDDLNFFFIQRSCMNNITKVNLIRTAGLQFATDRGLDALDQYYDTLNNPDPVPSFLNPNLEDCNIYDKDD